MADQLRAAAQQALEALENCSSEYGHRCNRCDSEVDEGGKVASALRAALAQAEPDHETRAELAEQQVVQLAEERDHYRRLWQKSQQAKPVCKCDLRTRLLGDGCGVCNPELAAELARQAEPVQRTPATGAAPCVPSPSFQMNAQAEPCDMGQMCLNCQPRGPNGECPDKQATREAK